MFERVTELFHCRDNYCKQTD